MGCCCSREEDRFEGREALLAKNTTTERSAWEDKSDVDKAKHHAANGHYTKPVTTAAVPSVAKPVANGNGVKKPFAEEVHPTVESVDLLGLDQPPSPPANHEKPTVESPKEVLSNLMPPRPSPPPAVLAAMKKAAEEKAALEKAALEKAALEKAALEKAAQAAKEKAAQAAQAAKEKAAQAAQAAKAAPPVLGFTAAAAPVLNAAVSLPSNAAPVPSTSTPSVGFTSEVSLDESVDLEDGNDNDDGEGENGDDATMSASTSSASGTSSSKNKKKKKKKGKK